MPNRFEWAHRAWPILTAAAKRRQTMTYGELGERLGIGGATPVRNALWPIQDLCMEKEWPPLTGIVLNKQTGQPGVGFIAWDGNLQDAHEEVFSFPWDEMPTPFPKGFVEKLDRSGRSGSDPDTFDVPDHMVLVNGRQAFQGKFRQMLLRIYDWQCALCETDLESMLVASHIVPWSADRKNRLNPQNGLLLCKTHDCLFDLGVIKITPKGAVSWRGATKKLLGAALWDFVTEYTESSLRMPDRKYKPDPRFLQWRVDNPRVDCVEEG